MNGRSSVTIDLFALEAFAEELSEQGLTAPQWREPWYPREDDETFVQFLGVANAINFCYTQPGHEKFAIEWNGTMLAGSAGLMAALQRAREGGLDILNADVLGDLSLDDMRDIFHSDAGPLPLMESRLKHLRNVGQCLNETYEGSFLHFLRCYQLDATVITHCLQRDFIAYGGDFCLRSDGTLLRFDKRARLMPLMYEGRARSSNGALPLLENYSAIGPVIDYQVAKTLWAKDVLVYSANLAGKIEREVPLIAWESEELAIRFHAHHAVELLLERVIQLQRAFPLREFSMVELDYALWSAGKNLPGKHHLCITTTN